RVHDVQPELGEQADRFRPPGQHRLCADIDHRPADGPEAELPAHVRRALEQQDRQTRRGEVARGDQAGDPATHHHGIGSRVAHGVTLASVPERRSRRLPHTYADPVPSAPFVVPPLLLIAGLLISAVAKLRDPRDTWSVFDKLRLPRFLTTLRAPV